MPAVFCILHIVEVFLFENQHFSQNINCLAEKHSKTYHSPLYLLKQRTWFNFFVRSQDDHHEHLLQCGRVARGWAYFGFFLPSPSLVSGIAWIWQAWDATHLPTLETGRYSETSNVQDSDHILLRDIDSFIGRPEMRPSFSQVILSKLLYWTSVSSSVQWG